MPNGLREKTPEDLAAQLAIMASNAATMSEAEKIAEVKASWEDYYARRTEQGAYWPGTNIIGPVTEATKAQQAAENEAQAAAQREKATYVASQTKQAVSAISGVLGGTYQPATTYQPAVTAGVAESTLSKLFGSNLTPWLFAGGILLAMVILRRR